MRLVFIGFFFSSRRRHTRWTGDWSSDVCSSDLVGRPLSPEGLAMALRRHSPDPWTLPRMIRAGSLTPLAAGLLSFLIDGRSTILIAGSRGAGKSSLLGALLFEFSRNQRILTIEDTLELPGPQLQDLGYKVQSLYIESALGGKGEMS